MRWGNFQLSNQLADRSQNSGGTQELNMECRESPKKAQFQGCICLQMGLSRGTLILRLVKFPTI
ncbi:unnamed protein product [Tuwongella immobilis]|uniref:Uncharacterized protein n=1 Tax=Tuwongella immobilis TaxID=692036 RepID=A0A6C2YJ58_9BACT|nr:unnamed protein product [Tuwongella immobilis]VTR97675.1 unnamed protein product [Tuwongella immobilis]